jgi:putative ABC transport system ATP-binding protein
MIKTTAYLVEDTAALMSQVPTLVFEDVDKTLSAGGDDVHILRGISLELAGGELVALVGPSGSGKSTILGIAAGLDSPTSGRVTIAGTDITGMSERLLARLRARQVGMVFQAYNLLPTLTALENVELPLLVPGQPRRDSGVAAELLASVGLGHRLHHRPAQLSGGEQQRVAVARALITEPALLIADEPTGNLDSATGEALIDVLLDVRRRRGTTVLVATHNDALARRADRVLRVRDGRLVG